MDHGDPAPERPGHRPGPANGAVTWTTAVAGCAAAALILGLATLGAAGVGAAFDRAIGINEPAAWPAGSLESLTTTRLALFLFAFQAATLALVAAAARVFRHGGVPLLPLAMPPGGMATLIASMVALLALASAYGAFVFMLDRGALVADVKPFAELMRTRTWWLMLIAAAIGAPLAEEFLFRGFLFGVLRASPAGLAGAVLVTAAFWAALHAQYSLYGLGAIFLIGVYLGWLRHKTGSLIAPMACHGMYNALVVLALSAAPDTAFQAA